VVNAGTMEKDQAQFQKHLNSRAKFANLSDRFGKLDLQGPLSRELLSPMVPGIEKLQYYTFDEFEVLGENVIVSRTGYTGELGYEIYFPWEKTVQLWKEILKRGAKPAGLGVRDLLRLEMGYSLYGHELEENISPLDAGLNRFIDWNKNFIGKEALLKHKEAGVNRKIVLFVSENRRSPRAGHRLYSSEGKEIGYVTSGSFSPNFNCGIGMGFVVKDRGSVGERILFGDPEQQLAARIEARPMYKQGSLKN
ncbi:MAG: glycine cleavage system protein T, partial [Candidatus Omnitrophica bacterium]|nr:glycine cleavage system protein T [Candidatus Omnitrophota bacterium]